MLLEQFINHIGGDLVFYCNVTAKQIIDWKQIPEYYKEVLKSYFELTKPSEVDFHSQCIWNNCEICIDKKPCFFEANVFMWYEYYY